jgi:TatA/E family protein of Tat protein translocase
MLGDIFGVDGVIVLIVIAALLFGSSQIPTLARSLGTAQSEFILARGQASTPSSTREAVGTRVRHQGPSTPDRPLGRPG